MKEPERFKVDGPGPNPYDFYQDTAFEYLQAHTLVGPKLSCTLADLHAAYERSCRAKGLTPAARNWFGRYVRKWVNQTAIPEGWWALSKQRNGRTYYIGISMV